MTMSIEKRIRIIMFGSLLFVGVMVALMLVYFSKIYDNIEQRIGRDVEQVRLGQKVQARFYDLKWVQGEVVYYLRTRQNNENDKTLFQLVGKKIEAYETVLQEYEKISSIQGDSFSRVIDLKGQVKKYSESVQQIEQHLEAGESLQLRKLDQKFKELLEDQEKMINGILTDAAQTYNTDQEFLGHLISNANRTLIFFVTIAILFGVIVIYFFPQKVTNPIRIYTNAIRELRDLKFETRLPINGQNELAVLGEEINKFVSEFVQFDEMKRKKIQFEKRKMQVLADMLNLGVVVISVEGEVLYLNAQMAKFLSLHTEAFQKKDFHFVRLPDEMKELFEDALSKKEKFENRMVILSYHKTDENGESHQEAVELLVDAGMVRNYIGDVANVILTFEDISASPQNSVFKRLSFSRKS